MVTRVLHRVRSGGKLLRSQGRECEANWPCAQDTSSYEGEMVRTSASLQATALSLCP